MSKSGKITRISPANAIPGSEIEIEVEGLSVAGSLACFANGLRCRVVAASSSRILAIMPECDDSTVIVQIENGGDESNAYPITFGKLLTDGMHIVANPAIDPSDDALILTVSGSRGQQLPNTLFRLETDGYLDALPVEIMNPTSIAFSPSGSMYVTNRSDGSVCRIDRGEDAIPFATGLGIATGLAFDSEGVMHVGDRSGTIYRVAEFGRAETFAVLEPSVSAYHIAFAADGRLFVSAPGLASHDAIYAIDKDGGVEKYARGFGRPQGIAFDKAGNLYAAACHKGRHGIVRVDAQTRNIENFAAGNNLVGLCFTRNGEMIVATNDSVYSLNVGIYGTLFD